jgi:hypothetical protein
LDGDWLDIMEQEVQQAPKELLVLLGKSGHLVGQLDRLVLLDCKAQQARLEAPEAQVAQVVFLVLLVLLGFKALVVLEQQEPLGFKGHLGQVVGQEELLAQLVLLEKLGPLVQVVIRGEQLALLAQLVRLGLHHKYLVVLKNHIMDLVVMVICIGGKRLIQKELVYG